MEERETIAAIATAPGRGGVAVVRVSGPDAHALAARLAGRAVGRADAGRFFRARLRLDGALLDEALVLVFAAPHSYTGEDVVEFQTHGGAVTPRRVLEACLNAGARPARRGEFTLRAFLNGRLDLGAAEAVIDLVDARSARGADDALARLAGEGAAAHEALYAAAIELSSVVEHALDFSEDELPDGFAAHAAAALDDLAARTAQRLARAREGRLLREGALVVLVGAPNAGKSSLLNALLGAPRAIVSPAAGTTRDFIEEGLELSGWPIRLVDTAGLRAAADGVEAEGVERAKALAARADVVLALDCAFPGALAVHAKCDLDDPARPAPKGLAVSAKTGAGLDGLKAEIVRMLVARAGAEGDGREATVTEHQRALLAEAAAALARARAALAVDWVVAANEIRAAAERFGAIVGKTYSDDLLDALFSRFCVGK